MVRWMLVNMNRGELDGRRILKEVTYDVMWKPGAVARQGHVGISWFLRKHKGQQVVMHGGQDDGFLTTLVLLPARKTAWWSLSTRTDAPLSAIEKKAFLVGARRGIVRVAWRLGEPTGRNASELRAGLETTNAGTPWKLGGEGHDPRGSNRHAHPSGPLG